MKRLFTPAALTAALLTSTGAQAHQYTQEITSWTARLNNAEKAIRDVQCSLNDLEHLATCQPANTARVVARLLATVKPDASDAEAREVFQIAAKVMSLTDDEEGYKRMYADLLPENRTRAKERALNRGLTELMQLSSEIGLTGLGEKAE